MEITWRYRCSVCGETFHPDEVAAHLEEEKAKPDWPGHVELTRVDDEGDGGEA